MGDNELMDINQIIKDLLSSSSPSIRYRLRKEVLGLDSSCEEMQELQKEILKEPSVARTLELFRPEGFSGSHYHSNGLNPGEEALEVCLRFLLEKGVEPDHPGVEKALCDLEEGPPFYDREIHRIGGFLDKSGLGGSSLIRTYLLARGGKEESPIVQEEIGNALEVFRWVRGVHSIKEVAEEYRDRLVFRPRALWPGIYHFRLLAYSSSWRKEENCALVAEAVENLVQLSPLPFIYLKVGSQFVAPATVFALDFLCDLSKLDEPGWAHWFERSELLSRIGVFDIIPQLKEQKEELLKIISTGYEVFQNFRSHRSWTVWSAYSGLALEPDWRSKEARTRDALLRSLLVLHFFESAKREKN
jgi:hypothetical protein